MAFRKPESDVTGRSDAALSVKLCSGPNTSFPDDHRQGLEDL